MINIILKYSPIYKTTVISKYDTMKFSILSLATLIFLLHFNPLNAQTEGKAEYLVKYEVDFAIDSTQKEERSKEMHYLYTGSDVSYYASEGSMIGDTLFAEMRERAATGNWRSMRRGNMGNRFESARGSKFSPQVYKDLLENKTWVGSRLMRDFFIYEEPQAELQWEFSGDSKEIGAYQAQKATTEFGGRSYEAWFTLEVPINDGPYVFKGLPGLILELADTQGDYVFNVTSIKPLKQKVTIKQDNKEAKIVQKKEFIKAYKAYRENPLGEMASRLRNSNFSFNDPTTGKTMTGADLIRQAKKTAAEQNNYIERW